MTPNRTDKPPDLPQKGAKTPPKGAEHCNLRGIWLVEAVLYRNLQGLVALAGPKKSYLHKWPNGRLFLHPFC